MVGNGNPLHVIGSGGSVYFGGGGTFQAGGGAQSVLVGGNGDRLYSAGAAGDLFGPEASGDLLMLGVNSSGNDVFFGIAGTGTLTLIAGSACFSLEMTQRVALGHVVQVVRPYQDLPRAKYLD